MAGVERLAGGGRVVAAPDLGALRNVIGDLFEAVRLVRSDDTVAEVSQRMDERLSPGTTTLCRLSPMRGGATGCCSNCAPQPSMPRR